MLDLRCQLIVFASCLHCAFNTSMNASCGILILPMLFIRFFPSFCFSYFFFQAEDGIRDRDVTGVQTCALPIYITQQCQNDVEHHWEDEYAAWHNGWWDRWVPAKGAAT